MDLAIQKRGLYRSTEYLSETRVKLAYEMNDTMGNDPDDNALLFQAVLKV